MRQPKRRLFKLREIWMFHLVGKSIKTLREFWKVPHLPKGRQNEADASSAFRLLNLDVSVVLIAQRHRLRFLFSVQFKHSAVNVPFRWLYLMYLAET